MLSFIVLRKKIRISKNRYRQVRLPKNRKLESAKKIAISASLGQMHIFRFLQKYLIEFNPRLWLGNSKTFTELPLNHSCCVFRFIVLLEGEPSAQSEVLNALDWVFIKAQYIIVYSSISIF